MDEEVMLEADYIRSSSKKKGTMNSSSLNCKNYMNFLFYFMNASLTYGIGTAAWFGTTTNGDLSEKYQTLVTPENIGFAIWGIVFLFQGLFAFVQLTSSTRDVDMVQDGVGYWYLVTCAAQVGWSFAFGYEYIGMSVILIFVIWLSLAVIVYNQYCIRNRYDTMFEFWLLRFPFEVHCGWVSVATFLNISVYVVKNNVTASQQLTLGIVSLALLHLVTFWVLFGMSKPNFTIPSVIAWGMGWIYYKLQSPKDVLKSRFAPQVLTGVRDAAYVLFIFMIVQIIVRLLFLLVNKLRRRNTVQYTQELANAATAHDDEYDGKEVFTIM